uniref:Uncharacterized protein n=1 Tax=Peronospora matthiolae TaxID=2874970 RepID=A0AAV1VBD9_9STRA
MRLCANLLLMAVPLHLCFSEVAPIPPKMVNPSLRSAPFADAGARKVARSLRELNAAAGNGKLPESVAGFAGHVMPAQASNDVSGAVQRAKLKEEAMWAEYLAAPYVNLPLETRLELERIPYGQKPKDSTPEK